MKEFKLTERQRKFAEEHHKVLEDFLRYRRLPPDEFYDVVVFSFLRAVKQYDEREELRKYSFKTIAKNHMRSALGHYFAQLKRQNKNLQILSLDFPISSEPELKLGDCIADEKVNICETVSEKLSSELIQCQPLHISDPAPVSYKAAA